MSIWRYGTKMSATRIFLAPVRKRLAPEIILGSARPANSVGKAHPPYFTARVLQPRVHYKKKSIFFSKTTARALWQNIIIIIVHV